MDHSIQFFRMDRYFFVPEKIPLIPSNPTYSFADDSTSISCMEPAAIIPGDGTSATATCLTHQRRYQNNCRVGITK
ncbi:unnamed protein product [Callosobruchus maculatus]|uniref:Uncharacterized protein n=1 Tax=Callosobruchus maculatus TaxID=64391 RepID=A0A653CGX7_CALMS|nr:unnamed protein product [Callosobruchus maculatus]